MNVISADLFPQARILQLKARTSRLRKFAIISTCKQKRFPWLRLVGENRQGVAERDICAAADDFITPRALRVLPGSQHLPYEPVVEDTRS